MSDTILDHGHGHGHQRAPRAHGTRSMTELLSSMRFAIALLTVICISSVIGTVIKQHEPVNNYVNQFGPFWADLFLTLKLNAVYSAWWFLLILAFLVISTSLCIARHAPKYLADLRNYKENIREKSLQAFHHKANRTLAGESTEAAAQRIGKLLVTGGWKVRLQQRHTPTGDGWMVAAKAGAAHKLGYIAAHSAIVLVCLGGLLDGDLIVRAQMWLGGKTPYAGGGFIADVKPEHRLPASNPTFRGNLLVTEGKQASTAILTQSDGLLLQELPFSVELKKFIVEHYSTGMPKLFASDIVIHDLATGQATPARVEVNHPVNYRGVEIYQSSFDDGGSEVSLHALPLVPGGEAFDVQGVIGGATQLKNAGSGEVTTLEFTGLRVLNVENFADGGANGSGVDVRKVDLRASIESRLGAGNKTVSKRDLRNVGPSVSYKLRDAAGQAREYQNFMLPVDTGDGQPV
ncbi:MAG TPA: cytochrome c biogenesis protein ResB, partial [Alicycliphilus sp.]|nr:cytochrome c biogenesis protein ResB [Alicycliphilus sp.]